MHTDTSVEWRLSYIDDRNDADLADLLSGMLNTSDQHRQDRDPDIAAGSGIGPPISGSGIGPPVIGMGPPMPGLMSSGLRLYFSLQVVVIPISFSSRSYCLMFCVLQRCS